MFVVYVLKSDVAKKSYVGYTNNLQRRLREHNRGDNYYTRGYIPWSIVYTEEYDNLNEAISREKFLKTMSGRRFMKKKIFN